jgi:transcriptional regulator GlxA family with amidase domain
MMSHLDGLAFCRHLRADERTSHIPLILLTGRTDNASRLEALALSRIQLYRKLKALTDQSPTDFLRAFRLQRAVDLLAGSTSTVADVAYAVGFNSLSCFGKCFRERFDCPPSEHPRQKTL